MSLRNWLKERLAREEFFPGPLSFLTSPYFITRYHLGAAVADRAPRFGGDLLDFGCGSKPYESLFSNARRYIGVDVEVSGHDHATSKVDHFYKDGHLPFADATFDSVVSFEVFEHVVDLEPMVAELFRVAKPGADIFITTPFVFPEHEIPYDFRRLTRYGLESMLARHGFEIVEVTPTTGTILAVAQCFNHYIFREATPNFRIAKILTQLLVTLPATMLAYAMHFVLPRGSALYVNLAVVARKPGGTGDAGQLPSAGSASG